VLAACLVEAFAGLSATQLQQTLLGKTWTLSGALLTEEPFRMNVAQALSVVGAVVCVFFCLCHTDAGTF